MLIKLLPFTYMIVRLEQIGLASYALIGASQRQLRDYGS